MMTYIYLMQDNLILLTEIKAYLCIWASKKNGNVVTAVIADSEPWLFTYACLGLINLNSMLEGNIDYAY